MRVLLAAALLLLAAATAGASGPRVEVERYLAGAGDVGCIVGNLGCVRFGVEGGESRVHVAASDDTGRPIAIDVCSPDCNANAGHFCGAGLIEGLTPGDYVFIFVRNTWLMCPILSGGPALSGTVTATFS